MEMIRCTKDYIYYPSKGLGTRELTKDKIYSAKKTQLETPYGYGYTMINDLGFYSRYPIEYFEKIGGKLETPQSQEEDLIHNPKHYTEGFVIEPLVFILKNKLSFPVGNIIKYACRYDKKGTPIQDLEKVKEYADRLIKELKEAGESL